VRELGFCVRWSYKLDEFFCRAVAVYIIAESGDMSTKYHNFWENWTTGCGIFMTSMAAVVTCTKNAKSYIFVFFSQNNFLKMDALCRIMNMSNLQRSLTHEEELYHLCT